MGDDRVIEGCLTCRTYTRKAIGESTNRVIRWVTNRTKRSNERAIGSVKVVCSINGSVYFRGLPVDSLIISWARATAYSQQA